MSSTTYTKAQLVERILSHEGASEVVEVYGDERAMLRLAKAELAELHERLFGTEEPAPAAPEPPATPESTRHAVALVNMTDGSVQGHAAGCADLGRKRKGKVQQADEPWELDVATRHEAWDAYNADFVAEHDPDGCDLAAGECGNAYTIDWLPCAAHVPAFIELTEAKAEAPAKPAPKAKAAKPAKAKEAKPSGTVQAATKATSKEGSVRQYVHIYAKALATNSAAALAFSPIDVDTKVTGTWADARLVLSGNAKAVKEAHALLDAIEDRALAAMAAWAATAPERKEQTGSQRRIGSRQFVDAFGATVAARIGGKRVANAKGDSAATRAGREAAKLASLAA